MARDFDSRREALAERDVGLRASEERYRSLIRKVQTAIVLHDGQGRILDSNPMAEELLGLSADQLLGKSLSDLEWQFLREDGSAMPVAEYPVSLVLSTGEPLRGQVTGIIRPGRDEVAWGLVNAEPEYGAAGAIALVIVSFVDITERKRGEEAMRRERALLRCLIDSASDLIFVKDRDSVYLGCNKASEAFLGIPEAEQVGKTDFDFFDPERARGIRDNDREVLQEGKPFRIEEWLTSRDGDRVLLDTLKAPYYGPDGEVLGLVGICRDITERNKAEALSNGQKLVLELIAKGAPLPESLTALVRLIEEQAPGMLGSILLLDEEGVHLRHGAAPSLQPQYTAAIDGAAIGPNAGSCGTAAYRREAVFVEDIATDPLWHAYKAVALPHGLRACWSTPVFDAQRRVLGIFAMYYRQPGLPQPDQLRLVDMAAQIAAIAIGRDRAETALRESEELHRLTLSNISDAILITDDAGSFKYVCLNVDTIFSYSVQEVQAIGNISYLLGENLFSLDEYEAWRELRNIERDIPDKTGKVHSLLINVKQITIKGGTRLYVCRDITELKRAQNQLRESEMLCKTELERLVRERTAQLEQANVRLMDMDRLKSMFIASMSHELRTPLNAIIGFIGLTLQGLSGALNKEQRDNLGRAYQSAKHLLGLILDIIDISKIEAGKIASFPEKFPLEELLDEAIASVTPQLREKGLLLEREPAAGLTVYADRKRLFQCLSNLLSNAVKFTEKGRVAVAARESQGRIELSVTDSGIGIAEQDLPRLFKPFERLESHLRVQAGGTGLGLYLTAKLVADILRGTISVLSREGEGSTFTLSLPLDLRRVPEPSGPEGEGGGTP